MFEAQIISMWMAGTAIILLAVALVIFLLIVYRRRLNIHYREQQRLLSINLEEEERLKEQIAKEVHDNIGQLANLLRMTLHRIENIEDKDERALFIQNANKLADLLIDNSANISHSLNSDFIKSRGLCNIIQDDIAHIQSSGKLTCKFDVLGDQKFIDPDRELIIYRIVQEALHNSLKHSNASMVLVRLIFSYDEFVVMITDNGIGFTRTDKDIKGGLGLMNMNDRAKILNGNIRIASTPGLGCTISLSCPY